jgi:hypothetical protein
VHLHYEDVNSSAKFRHLKNARAALLTSRNSILRAEYNREKFQKFLKRKKFLEVSTVKVDEKVEDERWKKKLNQS